MRLHALQYLRAIAALAVVYSHTALQVEDYARFLGKAGSFGVDIFFVISGFIMIYIAKPGTRPVAFFMARIRRVVPLYWFFTFLMVLILVLAPGVFKTTTFEWRSFLLSLSFIPHWSVAYQGFVWPIVAPGWSLIFEMYFYLIFAVSLLLAERHRVLFITAVITVVFAFSTFNHTEESALTLFFSKSMVFEFILGMYLAVAWKEGLRLPSSTGWYLLVLGISMLFLQLPGPRILEYGLPSVIIVMACLYLRIGEYKWAVLLGDASYALYLSHIFTLGVLRKILPPLLGEGQLAAYLFTTISLVVCMLVGIVIHKYIDNWLLRTERLQFSNKPSAGKAKA